MFILENGNAKRKGLFLTLFQLQNETSTTNQEGNMKWPSVCPHGLPSLFQMIKCMVVGSSWSDNWNISDYGGSELLLESGKQKKHCQADMLALWLHGYWKGLCDGLTHWNWGPHAFPTWEALVAVTGVSAVCHYSKPKSILLPTRNAKGNTHTYHKEMWRQLQDEKDYIQRAHLHENTLKSWDKFSLQRQHTKGKVC